MREVRAPGFAHECPDGAELRGGRRERRDRLVFAIDSYRGAASGIRVAMNDQPLTRSLQHPIIQNGRAGGQVCLVVRSNERLESAISTTSARSSGCGFPEMTSENSRFSTIRSGTGSLRKMSQVATPVGAAAFTRNRAKTSATTTASACSPSRPDSLSAVKSYESKVSSRFLCTTQRCFNSRSASVPIQRDAFVF